jgi:hypothetical protein
MLETGMKHIPTKVCILFFSLLALEGVIIESRTEPRSRISLLLVNNFLLLTSG